MHHVDEQVVADEPVLALRGQHGVDVDEQRPLMTCHVPEHVVEVRRGAMRYPIEVTGSPVVRACGIEVLE